jgi:hypothetical protein
LAAEWNSVWRFRRLAVIPLSLIALEALLVEIDLSEGEINENAAFQGQPSRDMLSLC